MYPTEEDWELPTEGDALALVDSDFDDAAASLGVEAAAIHAVATVESGGRTGFDGKKPKIRFETHVFRKYSGGLFNESNPELTAPYDTPAYYASAEKNQWDVIKAAFALDKQAAVKSTSWGMFQVMGFNAPSIGWSIWLREFVDDMFRSEAQHLRGFSGFVRANGLVPALQTHDWAAFASAYNGTGYRANNYDGQMRDAYARYSNP